MSAGGRLVYSTCALEPDENECVVEAFLKDHPEFQPIPLGGSWEGTGEAGSIRTWPQRDDVDGFFTAGFRRLA